MKHQTEYAHDYYFRLECFRIVLIAFMLLFPAGILWPVWAASTKALHGTGIALNSCRADTVAKTTKKIPLAPNTGSQPRPRFNTIHITVGFGGTTSNYSELEPLGVKRSPISIPLSLYAHIPFQHNYRGLFLLSGFDIDLIESNRSAFRALLIYQTGSGIMLGMGAGRTSFGFYEEVHIETAQTQGLLALGINLSPKRVDLLLTVPLAPNLSAQFDGAEYSVRSAGIQLSLLFSIRP